MFRSIKNIILTVCLFITVTTITATVILFIDRTQILQARQDSVISLNKCLENNQNSGGQSNSSSVSAGTTTNSSTSTTSAPVTCVAPDIASCFHQSINGWLVLNSPCTGQQITGTIRAKGVAFGTFEGTLNYELVNASGRLIASGFVNVTAPDVGVPGLFDQNITIEPAVVSANSGEAKFRVFMISPRDGEKQNTVEVMVRL